MVAGGVAVGQLGCGQSLATTFPFFDALARAPDRDVFGTAGCSEGLGFRV